jgi:enoyl-CoA hydratase
LDHEVIPGITLDDYGHFAWLIFDRPQAKNAINRAAMNQLEDIVSQLELRPDLVLLGLRGAGDVFVSGGDIKDLAKIKSAEEASAMSSQMNDVLLRLARLSCLTVAVINGNAYGGGCEIALACDVRIMNAKAQLFFKQVAMGLTPGWGGGQRLAKLIGCGRATMLYATVAQLNAAEALALGVVDLVADDSIKHLEQWAEAMKAASPTAIHNTKRAIFDGDKLGPSAAFSLESHLFAEAWASEPHLEAVQAFLNRKS